MFWLFIFFDAETETTLSQDKVGSVDELVSKLKEAGVFSMNKNMNNGVAQKLGFSAATVLQRDSCR